MHFYDILRRVDDAIDATSAKLGRKTVGVGQLMLMKISGCVDCMQESPGVPIEILAAALKDYAGLFTEEGNLEFVPNLPVEQFPSTLISYPPCNHISEQQRRAPIQPKQIRTSLFWEPHYRFLLHRFPYVVGPDFEWRSFSTPQPPNVSFAGRSSDTTYPMHPQLAEEFGLKARVAGEVAMSWNQGHKAPEIVLCNDFSGHFKPEGWNGKTLASLLSRIHGWDGQTSFISITQANAIISGPLCQEILDLANHQNNQIPVYA